MAEIPILSPSVQISPSIGTSPRNDTMAGTGADVLARGIGKLADALQNIADQEDLVKAHELMSQHQFEYMGEARTLESSAATAEEWQKGIKILHDKYITDTTRQKDVRGQLGRNGYLAYRQGMSEFVLNQSKHDLTKAQVNRTQSIIDKAKTTLDTDIRDAASIPTTDANFDAKVNKINAQIDGLSEVLFPNKETIRKETFDRLFTAVAESQIRYAPNPIETVKGLFPDPESGNPPSFKVTIKNETRDIGRTNPELRGKLYDIAINEMQLRHTVNEQKRVNNERLWKQSNESLQMTVVGDILQGDFSSLAALADRTDINGRRILEAGDLRTLEEFRHTVERRQKEGGVTDRLVYGKWVKRIRDGEVTQPHVIMSADGLGFEDSKSLTASAISFQEKLKDTEFSRYHERVKQGESIIRGFIKSKNPFAMFGEVNPQAEILVTRYHARMNAQEDNIRATNGKFSSLDPLSDAGQFIADQTQFLSESFRQDADKLTHTLSEFIPMTGPVTHDLVHRNIEKSKLPRAEKKLMHAILFQAQQQGIQPEFFVSTLRQVPSEKPQSSRVGETFLETLRRLLSNINF